jgi:hypothetical protein
VKSKTVKFRGEVFLLDNISSLRFEQAQPAKVEMNVFSPGPAPRKAYLVITYTNGNSRTFEGDDAGVLNQLLEAELKG